MFPCSPQGNGNETNQTEFDFSIAALGDIKFTALQLLYSDINTIFLVSIKFSEYLLVSNNFKKIGFVVRFFITFCCFAVYVVFNLLLSINICGMLYLAIEYLCSVKYILNIRNYSHLVF